MGNPESFHEILSIVYRQMGLDCSAYNESYIRRRVNARMMAFNLPLDDFENYLKILAGQPDELRRLYDALTINVTQFFRDARLWQVLAQDVFPKVIEEKKARVEKTLTIWSCGCSSGEEPYSLAIVLKELLGERRDLLPTIIATDIDHLSLQKAHDARYDAAAFKEMPQAYLLKYFRQEKVKDRTKYALDPAVKAMVQFRHHNFLSEPAPGRNIDMVFCRNVIIYFTPAAKEKLMNTFHGALRERGWLVVGKSEVLFTIKIQNLFSLYNVDERIYRKERRAREKTAEEERRQEGAGVHQGRPGARMSRGGRTGDCADT